MVGRCSIAFTALSALLVGCTFGSGDSTTATTAGSSPSVTSAAGSAATPLPETTAGTSTTTTSTTSTTTTSTLPPTTTTTIPLITEGATIIVANASNVNGAATRLSQELAARGFHLADATNSAGIEERLDVSKVYFLPAGVDVAASVGRVMGGISVSQMPTPVSITGGPAALGEATVVVMLGTDLADKDPMLTGG